MIAVYVVVALLALMLMIAIHELGHYISARLLGFKINEFAIGMGKVLWKWTSKKTGITYSIRIFPLGGFCSFGGEDDAGSGGSSNKKSDRKSDANIENIDKEPKRNALAELASRETKSFAEREKERDAQIAPEPSGQDFNQTAPWKRLIVLFSGAFFNFVSAILFSLILLVSLGYNHGIVVGGLSENSPNAGRLQQGDVILSIGVDETFYEFSWLQSFDSVVSSISVERDSERIVTFVVVRNGDYQNPIHVEGRLVRATVNGVDQIRIGIVRDGNEFIGMSFIGALGKAFVFTIELAWMMLSFLWMLITGQLGLTGIAGPIGTVTVITETVSSSMLNLLLLLPLISVNLAVFNLLPIPALDGARMVFVGIEWIRGKPVRPELEGRIHMIGLLILFGLIILADINFLFGGGRGMLEIFGRWRI